MLTNRSNKSIVSHSRSSRAGTIDEDDTINDDCSASYYYEESTAIDDQTNLSDSTGTSWNGDISSLVRGIGVEIKPPGSSRRSYLPSIPSPPSSPPPSVNIPHRNKKNNPYDPGPSANHTTSSNGHSFEFDVSFRPIDLPIVLDNEQQRSSGFNVNGLHSLLKSHNVLFHNISTSRLAAYVSLLLIVLYFVMTLTQNQRHLSSSFSTPHYHKDELFFFTSSSSSSSSGGNPIGGPLHPQAYPPGGAVIVTLISNSTQNVEDLQVALRSMTFLAGERDPKHPTPVLVFNEGYLSGDQKFALVAAATGRPVAFPIVDFTEFPSGFDNNDDPPFPPIGRHNKWGYYQIIRFWITGLWIHPALDRFETVVKMEPNGCFKSENEHLPHFLLNHFVYHAAYGGYEPEGATYTRDLVSFVENYMEREGMKPKSPTSWQFLQITWQSLESVPIFSTNIEVISKSFMLTKEVMRFHRALTEWEPFGMWRHRWSVHAIRFMTMALFTEDELIMKSQLQGYAMGREQCSPEEVEAALERYAGELKKKKKKGYVRRR